MSKFKKGAMPVWLVVGLVIALIFIFVITAAIKTQSDSTQSSLVSTVKSILVGKNLPTDQIFCGHFKSSTECLERKIGDTETRENSFVKCFWGRSEDKVLGCYVCKRDNIKGTTCGAYNLVLKDVNESEEICESNPCDFNTKCEYVNGECINA